MYENRLELEKDILKQHDIKKLQSGLANSIYDMLYAIRNEYLEMLYYYEKDSYEPTKQKTLQDLLKFLESTEVHVIAQIQFIDFMGLEAGAMFNLLNSFLVNTNNERKILKGEKIEAQAYQVNDKQFKAKIGDIFFSKVKTPQENKSVEKPSTQRQKSDFNHLIDNNKF